ncbi:MAG TPA: feruloyl-CoA synthase [Bryobacteraceae bacterium]|nr:feruloyl-CoA synthase [Bryobacteraceae bacterium]
MRAVRVIGAAAEFQNRADGTILVRSPHALPAYPDKMTERLDRWAALAPERTFLARRGADGEWIRLSYAETRRRARAIAQSLIDRGLSYDRPIAILSGNSLEHALLALGAMYVGVLYTPIAPAYSLAVRRFDTLRHLWEGFRPALAFADDRARFGSALAAMPLDGVEVVDSQSFAALESAEPTAAVDAAHARVTPDTVVKILFTSGSTGRPKGVITTQRMLCANQEMIRASMQFLADEPPVLCDWLPWNHTFGGSHNFGIALYNGGSLYIDNGRPTPQAFEETARNLGEIATSAFFNVPKGFEMLVERMRRDETLRRTFFSKVQVLFYAAAGLSQHIWDELQEHAVAACGEKILMMTGLGATESAPAALFTGIEGAASGLIGLPLPGVELKLAPVDGKMEARLRGPSITPGFWRDEELTRASFDEEGFYRMGDAVKFADPHDRLRGFRFDGRLTEDFKLSTGTWVSAGPLRMKLLGHFGPLVQDVVLAGPDRDYVTAMIVPGAGVSAAEIRGALNTLALSATGSSTLVRRAVILTPSPSMEAGEMTDKGSLNQRAIRENRASLVAALYAVEPPAHVICVDEKIGATI